MYMPFSQAGAVADQPLTGAIDDEEDNAYSTVTEATEVCFSSSMSSFIAWTLKLMPLLEDRSSCSPKLAATCDVVIVPAFMLLPSMVAAAIFAFANQKSQDGFQKKEFCTIT
jgi:hypothetical protein